MEQQNGTHSIILENRNKLNLSGVVSVDNFDDNTVELKTHLGALTVKGEDLHITSFNTQTGDAMLDGTVIALVYTTDKQSGGFFKGLFR